MFFLLLFSINQKTKSNAPFPQRAGRRRVRQQDSVPVHLWHRPPRRGADQRAAPAHQERVQHARRVLGGAAAVAVGGERREKEGREGRVDGGRRSQSF